MVRYSPKVMSSERAPSDRRRLLEAVTGESGGEVEVLVRRGASDDEVLVEGVEVVVTAPGAGQLDRLERGHARRERGPHHFVEQVVVDVGVLRHRVPLGRGGDVDDESRAFGSEADAGLGNRQRRRADGLPALEHVRAPLARFDRKLDAERFADFRRARGAGGVDHAAAGDIASGTERYARDPRSAAAHRDHIVVNELDAEGPGLAPVCLEERVGIEVSLVAVAQEPAGDVAGAKPRAARLELVRGSEVNIRTETALHRIVLEHRGQHRLGRDQQVAILPETHVGGLAVDGKVVVEMLDEFDAEQPDPHVLGRGELLPESARGLRRWGVLVGRVAFDDQHRSIEIRFPGEKQRRGAAGDATPGDHNVVSVVSGIHAAIIPRVIRRAGTALGGLRPDEPMRRAGCVAVTRWSDWLSGRFGRIPFGPADRRA